jgi:hypothetical protein
MQAWTKGDILSTIDSDRTVQLALLTRSIFLVYFDNRLDLIDNALTKQVTKWNKPNQHH